MTRLPNALDLLDRKTFGQTPITVVYQVTARCNYSCVHCYQEHEPTDELTLAEIDVMFGQLAELGVLFVSLMGGEFFMRRDADDIIECAHRHGFSIRVKTTGHHVTEKRAKRLAAFGPIQFEISIYSANHAGHDAVTVQPGSLARSRAAADRLLALGIPVRFNTPVMESNVRDLAALKDDSDARGVFQSFDMKMMGMQDATLDPTRLRMSRESMASALREGPLATGLADVFGVESAYGAPDHAQPCGAGVAVLGIAPNGDVNPCNILPMPCGNVRERSIQDIWHNSENLKRIRDTRWGDIEDCNKCQLRQYCNRCYSMAMLENGDLMGPSLESCRVTVAKRDALREAGLISADDTALPPTWDRIEKNGQHDMLSARGKRPPGLHVLA